LPQSNDISSTEKLLEVIRKKEEEKGVQAPPPPEAPSSEKTPKAPPAKVIPLQKALTIGVDIGHDYMRVVKIKKSAEKKWELINYACIPLPPRASRETEEFSDFLQSELTAFCGASKGFDVWVNMSAAEVEVHHIRVPKVGKKQLQNAVFWTFKKETSFNEQESIFDFEVQGEVVEEGVPKLSAMVYTAPKKEIEGMKALFSDIGFPLTGISVTPFAVQNIFRTEWIPTHQGNVASLFIGNDFSRIDVYAKGNLSMTRGIKAGITSMAEALVEGLNGKAKTPLTIEQARKIVASLSPDSPPLTEADAGYGIAKEEIFPIIEPAIERLVRQVERTFEYHTTTLGNEKIDKIYISSAMNVYMPIVEYVGDQLGIERDILNPLSPQIPYLGGIVKDIAVSERVAFVPALGLALSDNAYTPNFIFTYKDKERMAYIAFLNKIILTTFVVLLFVCAGILISQAFSSSQKKAVIARHEKEVAQLQPRVDKELISQMLTKAREQQQLSKAYTQRYLSMAIISEISSLTPSSVRLLSLKANLLPAAQPQSQPAAAAAPKPGGGEGFALEGIIFGDRKELEASLAGYVLKLDASPMFNGVSVQSSSMRSFKKGDVLHFVLDIKIG
jgi:type IV pilus assembly protein PilM